MCGRLSSEQEALFCIGLPGPQPLRKGIAHRSPRWGPPTPFTAGQGSAPCEAGWVLVGRRESIDARFSQCALEGICRTHDECRAMAESHPCQGRQVKTVKILPRLSRPFFRWRPTERSKVAIAFAHLRPGGECGLTRAGHASGRNFSGQSRPPAWPFPASFLAVRPSLAGGPRQLGHGPLAPPRSQGQGKEGGISSSRSRKSRISARDSSGERP